MVVMQSLGRSYHLTKAFNTALLKQCCACGHGDAAVKPYSAIPGPKPWPIIGNALEMKANYKNLLDYMSEGFRKYGDIFKLNVLGNKFIVIKDPDSIEQLLRAEGKYPVRDITMSSAIRYLNKQASNLPPSFMFQDGEEWKRIRSAIGKQVTPRNVQTYCNDFNKIIGRFMDYIRNTRGEDEMIPDIAYPLKQLIVELSVKSVFDNDVTILGTTGGEYHDFVDAMDKGFTILSRVMFELPLYKLYNNEVARMNKEATMVTERIARKEMERLYARLEAGEKSETPGILEQWLREGKLSEERALRESITLIGSGVDTTGSQSAYLLYHMAKHPEVQERLYQEIKEVIGDSKYPTPQQLSQMPYMKKCILEGYRLLGPTGILSRVTAEDATILGYRIPAQTNVIYSVYSAGRDEKLFQDPLRFDPERWANKDDKHAFAVQPFGFGPRSCYGRRLAELELKLLLVQVINNFKITTPIDELKISWRLAVVPDEDISIQFIDRKMN